jgi:hypothetical protein
LEIKNSSEVLLKGFSLACYSNAATPFQTVSELIGGAGTIFPEAITFHPEITEREPIGLVYVYSKEFFLHLCYIYS